MILIVMSACSHSKEITGVWNAQESSGENVTIEFTAKKVIVDNQVSSYSLEKSGYKNGVNYVVINQNDKLYSIIFPDKNDDDAAVLIQLDSSTNYLKGDVLYALNRNELPNYKEYIYKYFE